MTIKEMTIKALKKSWLSNTQLVIKVGAASAGRVRRQLTADGVEVVSRKRKDKIFEYHIK